MSRADIASDRLASLSSKTEGVVKTLIKSEPLSYHGAPIPDWLVQMLNKRHGVRVSQLPKSTKHPRGLAVFCYGDESAAERKPLKEYQAYMVLESIDAAIAHSLQDMDSDDRIKKELTQVLNLERQRIEEKLKAQADYNPKQDLRDYHNLAVTLIACYKHGDQLSQFHTIAPDQVHAPTTAQFKAAQKELLHLEQAVHPEITVPDVLVVSPQGKDKYNVELSLKQGQRTSHDRGLDKTDPANSRFSVAGVMQAGKLQFASALHCHASPTALDAYKGKQDKRFPKAYHLARTQANAFLTMQAIARQQIDFLGLAVGSSYQWDYTLLISPGQRGPGSEHQAEQFRDISIAAAMLDGETVAGVVVDVDMACFSLNVARHRLTNGQRRVNNIFVNQLLQRELSQPEHLPESIESGRLGSNLNTLRTLATQEKDLLSDLTQACDQAKSDYVKAAAEYRATILKINKIDNPHDPNLTRLLNQQKAQEKQLNKKFKAYAKASKDCLQARKAFWQSTRKERNEAISELTTVLANQHEAIAKNLLSDNPDPYLLELVEYVQACQAREGVQHYQYQHLNARFGFVYTKDGQAEAMIADCERISRQTGAMRSLGCKSANDRARAALEFVNALVRARQADPSVGNSITGLEVRKEVAANATCSATTIVTVQDTRGGTPKHGSKMYMDVAGKRMLAFNKLSKWASHKRAKLKASVKDFFARLQDKVGNLNIMRASAGSASGTMFNVALRELYTDSGGAIGYQEERDGPRKMPAADVVNDDENKTQAKLEDKATDTSSDGDRISPLRPH